MKNISLVIMDLDNTVYDWYAAFVPAFYAMIESASKILDCKPDDILSEIREIHVLKNDVEHPFSLVETRLVRDFVDRLGAQEAMARLDRAFYAFNKTRKDNLRLFDGFLETALKLKDNGIRIAAFTESRYFGAIGRIDRLGIEHIFEKIYCRKNSDSSRPESYPIRSDQESRHNVITLPSDALKPNPGILLRIIEECGVDLENSIYIGDSLSKDVYMAKQIGCLAVWAKYGIHKNDDMYEKLIRISHWTQADIAREKHYSLLSKDVVPDFVCERSITELLDFVLIR